ncbi:hypothetical protein VP01_2934g1 [Puccinia sorghi]|uniref:Uncharacterized protein n=1 Tax=Puccinia sorghi TaxID=27349 RepID=A0A0L6V169_9BASI|nr:hypothetical protein VP01_2934g1 [Puccinia sorghi]
MPWLGSPFYDKLFHITRKISTNHFIIIEFGLTGGRQQGHTYLLLDPIFFWTIDTAKQKVKGGSSAWTWIDSRGKGSKQKWKVGRGKVSMGEALTCKVSPVQSVRSSRKVKGAPVTQSISWQKQAVEGGRGWEGSTDCLFSHGQVSWCFNFEKSNNQSCLCNETEIGGLSVLFRINLTRTDEMTKMWVHNLAEMNKVMRPDIFEYYRNEKRRSGTSEIPKAGSEAGPGSIGKWQQWEVGRRWHGGEGSYEVEGSDGSWAFMGRSLAMGSRLACGWPHWSSCLFFCHRLLSQSELWSMRVQFPPCLEKFNFYIAQWGANLCCLLHCKKKLAQLPAVDIQKVPGSFSLMHSHFADFTVTVPKIYRCRHVEFGWQLGWRPACQLQAVEQVFFCSFSWETATLQIVQNSKIISNNASEKFEIKLSAKLNCKKELLNCLQLTCSMLQPSCHPNSTFCTVTVLQILVESLWEKGGSNTKSFIGLSACQPQAVEQCSSPPLVKPKTFLMSLIIFFNQILLVFGNPMHMLSCLEKLPSISMVHNSIFASDPP